MTTPPEFPEQAGPGENEGVKFTDKRRIDPETGEVRTPPPAAQPAAEAETLADMVDEAIGDSDDLRVLELTADLQRVQAEYANYRKRAQRDQDTARELGVIAVVSQLLPVIDDIERARKHDELTGAFQAVGEALEAALAKLGLETYGTKGEPFDPAIHEALTHTEAEGEAEGQGPIVAEVFMPGFKYKDRVVRPARVAVLG